MTTTLDVRGKTITTYIACRATEALAELTEGDVLDVVSDESEAIDNDLRAWCDATGNRIVAVEIDRPGRRYRIEKHPAPHHDRSLALVVSDAGLEELLSPLGFALAAALEGIDVSIYFQGPAVRVLTKGFTARLHGWGRPFSRFARRGLERAGHVSAHEKVTELRGLGAHLYACGPSMQHFRVSKDDLAWDDVTIAEYLSFVTAMERADIHLFVQ